MKNIISAMIPNSGTPKIIKQFFAEFSAPLVITALWTGMEWHKADADYQWVSQGALHFFAAGWAFSQWNRIKKQKRTEDGLSDVMKTTKYLIGQINRSTSHMLGAATGGDSFCAFEPVNVTPIVPTSFAIRHIGDYPLYDVDVRIVDLDRLEKVGRHTGFENRFHFDVLIPNHLTSVSLKGETKIISINEIRRYNIFYTARNGSFDQFIQMQFVEGRLLHASKFFRDDEGFFEVCCHGYPKNIDGAIDWTGNE